MGLGPESQRNAEIETNPISVADRLAIAMGRKSKDKKGKAKAAPAAKSTASSKPPPAAKPQPPQGPRELHSVALRPHVEMDPEQHPIVIMQELLGQAPLRPHVELDPDQHPVAITPELVGDAVRPPVVELDPDQHPVAVLPELPAQIPQSKIPPAAAVIEIIDSTQAHHPGSVKQDLDPTPFAVELSGYSPQHGGDVSVSELVERQARIRERRRRLLELEQLEQEEEEIRRRLAAV
ncbi:hypothetical protein B0T24DRAFT_620634 [Lasiosphaeria ovina]|uniref:Uncharacterized protein n=1 Tax=Lasiosphaeria ovina TaxID=92902 RepID=A0AAE0KIF4_9PEZI|nr:hypothetical protein B0T24DRAFT_620634 [Lasiosphaeria ovina]